MPEASESCTTVVLDRLESIENSIFILDLHISINRACLLTSCRAPSVKVGVSSNVRLSSRVTLDFFPRIFVVSSIMSAHL